MLAISAQQGRSIPRDACLAGVVLDSCQEHSANVLNFIDLPKENSRNSCELILIRDLPRISKNQVFSVRNTTTCFDGTFKYNKTTFDGK